MTPVELESVLGFANKSLVDSIIAPAAPWEAEMYNVVDNDGNRVAETVALGTAVYIAGLRTAVPTISTYMVKLARLMAEASKNGPQSQAWRELCALMAKAASMADSGALPVLND